MIVVKVNGNIERGLKQFKNKTQRTKLLQALRELEEFVPESEKKRKRKERAIYLNRKFDIIFNLFFSLQMYFLKKFILFEINR